MTRYPSECPVFEVLSEGSDARIIRNGAIVEGASIAVCFDRASCQFSDAIFDRNFIGVYPAKEDCFWDDISPEEKATAERAGFLFGAIHRSRLRPLTRAARDMLAIVTP